MENFNVKEMFFRSKCV